MKFQIIRSGLALSALALMCSASASTTVDSAYFVVEGNPVAAKYVSGRLIRLPVQDAEDPKDLMALESVSALVSAQHLSELSDNEEPAIAHISQPRRPEYGVPMFDVSVDRSEDQKAPLLGVAWSGRFSFKEVALGSMSTDISLRRRLVAESRRFLLSKLDFRAYRPVGRRLEVDGSVKVRDYGRTAAAPDLAFIDITWRIRNIPDALSSRGIDSLSPFWRVEYVVNVRTGRIVYKNATNVGGVEDRGMRLFKEPGGPLLMAVTIACSDGSEPMIMDLESETYGTGTGKDVPEVTHCYPAQ
jgi:hypothetical protein